MKLSQNILFVVTAVILASCSASEEPEVDKDLVALKAERDSLKERLSEVNLRIQELDTATASLNPIVTAEPVVVKDFVHKIEVLGAVETDKNAMINAEAQGTIRKVHVKEGDKVREGQPLVTIDAVVLSSQIQELETQLELAEFMFEKQKKLMEEGVGTEIEYEQAKAQKNSLEKSIQTMRSQVGKSVVRAPFSGVVDQVMISIGEMAAPGVPLMRIVNNSNVKITASLSENLLSKVYTGTPVDLVIPSLNDTVIKSEISSRGNFIDPVNRTFRIRIDVEKNKLLLPNQLAKVNVTDFSKKDALVISSEAILQDTKNRNYVYKLVKTKGEFYNVKKVYVKVLSRYMGEACIETVKPNALTAKSRVVVAGAKGITEADQVNIQ
ncbi:MAG: efflux RND transporter periplasmic adaptor subunit [Crocinitomicaceae bacterium]|nr:efflux RND transporter periplasmic adaptor subunit [Crocinitomicaceae bacterium]